jgi:glycosyltransferase involved in cell wall biosynthesis
MRIVYVLTSLGMGGAEKQVLALAARMQQSGHAVRLMVLRPPLAEQWPSAIEATYLGLSKTPGSLFASLARGQKLLRQFQPDLLHSHSFHANIVARLLKLSFPSAKVISTVHNVYEGGWHRMLAYRLTDVMSSQTTAVSHAAADRFVALKAVHRGKCVVVGNGIDLDEFSPDPDRRIRMRRELNADTEFVWLAAGRIVPAKDYPNLLRAFVQVRAVRKDAQLWIAGSSDPAHMASLQESSEFSSLGSAVRWLGLRRDMPDLLDAADGFVQASAWEGLPLSVAEAMAMEKPVVATDVGGVRELVAEAGRIVPAKDPAALAQSMLSLMEHSENERHALGCQARERIHQDFSMDARTDDWEALYANVLSQHRSAH